MTGDSYSSRGTESFSSLLEIPRLHPDLIPRGLEEGDVVSKPHISNLEKDGGKHQPWGVESVEAQAISAFAAAFAALAAASVAGIQLYVGHRQSRAALQSAQAALMNAQNAGRHTVAEFRQKWIDKVIDALSDHHAILMTLDDRKSLRPDENMKLAALRTKLEILLNPSEPDTIALLKTIDDIAKSTTAEGRSAAGAEMVGIARRLLKTEWVRIKSELQ